MYVEKCGKVICTCGTIIAVDYFLYPSPGMEQNLSPETQPLLHL